MELHPIEALALATIAGSASAWGCWVGLRTQIRHRVVLAAYAIGPERQLPRIGAARATTSSATSSLLASGSRVPGRAASSSEISFAGWFAE